MNISNICYTGSSYDTNVDAVLHIISGDQSFTVLNGEILMEQN